MAYIYGASITSFGSIAIISSFNLPTTSIEVTLPRSVVGLAHAPDIMKIAGEDFALPSSTNPTRPYTK